MRDNDTFIIAKGGLKCVGAAAALFLFMMFIDADFLTLLSFLLLLLTLWVYRNPERPLPYPQENSIVSVCDGTVKSIETVEDEEGNSTYNIVIASSFLDTSILRVPVTGRVEECSVVSGARLGAGSILAERLNEKALVVFGSGAQQVVVLHTLQLASVGISLNITENASVIQGTRYGMMIKGESMMALPSASRVSVKIGDRVRAGETLIGFFS